MPTVDESGLASPAGVARPESSKGVLQSTTPFEDSGRATRHHWHRLLWPGVCLFEFGLIVGLAVLWLRSSPPSSPVKTSDTKEDSRALLPDAARTTRAARAPELPGSLDQADELIR